MVGSDRTDSGRGCWSRVIGHEFLAPVSGGRLDREVRDGHAADRVGGVLGDHFRQVAQDPCAAAQRLRLRGGVLVWRLARGSLRPDGQPPAGPDVVGVLVGYAGFAAVVRTLVDGPRHLVSVYPSPSHPSRYCSSFLPSLLPSLFS